MPELDTTPVVATRSGIGSFLRLWLVLFFAYSLVKFFFNLAFLGYIDLTRPTFLEIGFVPLGQSVVLWLVTRRRRDEAPPPA